MIDHISMPVADLDRSRVFYDAALRPIQLEILETTARSAVYGTALGRHLLILHSSPRKVRVEQTFHVAFHASAKAAVDAFYLAGINAGGSDAGEPGPRLEYLPTYYAAYLEDPDGHRIEAVCR